MDQNKKSQISLVSKDLYTIKPRDIKFGPLLDYSSHVLEGHLNLYPEEGKEIGSRQNNVMQLMKELIRRNILKF